MFNLDRKAVVLLLFSLFIGRLLVSSEQLASVTMAVKQKVRFEVTEARGKTCLDVDRTRTGQMSLSVLGPPSQRDLAGERDTTSDGRIIKRQMYLTKRTCFSTSLASDHLFRLVYH